MIPPGAMLVGLMSDRAPPFPAEDMGDSPELMRGVRFLAEVDRLPDNGQRPWDPGRVYSFAGRCLCLVAALDVPRVCAHGVSPSISGATVTNNQDYPDGISTYHWSTSVRKSHQNPWRGTWYRAGRRNATFQRQQWHSQLC